MATKNSIRLGIVGVGKIARDQHLPSIAANPAFELIAAASRNGTVDGIQNFKTIEAMVEAVDDLDAVALCMPPQFRFVAAKVACVHGLHTLLEKPPGANVSEVQALAKIAADQGVSLFATWHSRFGGAVEQARTLLANSEIHKARIIWKEDVRKWHPGQDWIWQAGGMGVFDPGINALSILTHIIPQSLFVTKSHLFFPENRAAPIAANIAFTGVDGAQVEAEFDWRVDGDETWDIEVETDQSKVVLTEGGGVLHVDGETLKVTEDIEYPGIYQRFADLVHSRQSDVDLSPLQLCADAFLQGEREITEAFIEE